MIFAVTKTVKHDITIHAAVTHRSSRSHSTDQFHQSIREYGFIHERFYSIIFREKHNNMIIAIHSENVPCNR
jgi:hypothetical protein